MAKKFELDPNLRSHATDRQWELLSAWAERGSAKEAAEALGVAERQVRAAKRRTLMTAARRGYAPSYPAFSSSGVPPGFVLRGQSALVDADGNLKERWDKTRQEGAHPDEAASLPDPKRVVKLATHYDAEGRVTQQWVSERPEDRARETAWRTFAEELASSLPRVEPVVPPAASDDALVVGYPVGDHHVGMLAWAKETGDDYDMRIAEDLLDGAFGYLVRAAPPAADALVAFLGDFLHYDSFEVVTPTNRNSLDSDTRYPKMVRAAVRMMRTAIGKALGRHRRVRVVVEIGNHDLSSSIFLMECLRVAYENEPRVEVDTSPRHFHYARYGNVLIGTHHGHGVKMQDLPLLMAADVPEDWGATEYRYFWTGHLHHGRVEDATRARDFSGCVVERFRVLPPSDAWAAQKGYRPYRDMKAIVYNRRYGEVARHTVNPRMLLAEEG